MILKIKIALAALVIGFIVGWFTQKTDIHLSRFALREARLLCQDKMAAIYANKDYVYGKCGGEAPFWFKVQNYKK
jgi:hypothetical protein